MKEEAFEDWGELRAAIGQLQEEGEFIWRGHSSAAWKLSTSLYRFFESQGISPAERLRREECALDTFSDYYTNRLGGLPEKRRSRVDVTVLMQHFGCPTRLLDWTRSPYIAVYFCLDEMAEVGALYGLNLTEYQGLISERLPFDDYDGGLLTWLPDRLFVRLLNQADLRFPVPIAPQPLTRRQFEQQSIFTLDLSLETASEIALSGIAPHLIRKFTFPRAARRQISADLNQMNIDGYHLLGGRTGVALKAKAALAGVTPFGASIRTRDLEL